MPGPIKAILLAGALILWQGALALPAAADDRMAGSVHIIMPAQDEDEVDTQPAAAQPAAVHTSPARTAGRTASSNSARQAHSSVNFTALESHGLLTSASQGSLGRDLWHGTARSLLVEYLPQLPTAPGFYTVSKLVRKLLLTAADTSLLRADEKPRPGADLTTLRLQKLLEMGAYQEAFTLYTRHSSAPYHQDLARMGVLAAFYTKQPALGCLEARVVESRFSDVLFWQQIQKICAYFLSNEPVDPAQLEESPGFEAGTILRELVTKPRYRMTVNSVEALKPLRPLEIAALTAADKLDFSKFRADDPAALPPHVLGLLITEPSMPASQAFALRVAAAARGVITADMMASFYNDKAQELFGERATSLSGFKPLKGWQRLPYLYRALSSSDDEDEQAAIAEKLLALTTTYELAAFRPFAPLIAAIAPDKMTGDMIRTSLRIMMDAGTDIPTTWYEADALTQIQTTVNDRATLITYAAFRLATPGDMKDASQAADKKEKRIHFTEDEQRAIKIIYEKLDKTDIFHNYVAGKTYEKDGGLTSPVDYVMPSIGLIEYLKKAEYEKRLGEVILLSAIALRDSSPGNVKPGLVREIIDGLTAVGLIEEARLLAYEAALGMSEK